MSGNVNFPKNWRPYEIRNFAGGLNVGDSEVQPNELREAENMELAPKGAIKSRKGYRDCIPDNVTDNLAVSTQEVTDILATTATGNGTITSLGMLNPTAHGVVYVGSATPITNTLKDSATSYAGQDIHVSGNYAFIVSNQTNIGMTVWDITDKENIAYETLYSLAVTSDDGLYIEGDYAYICWLDGTYPKLDIVDISDPTAPSHVATYTGDQHNAFYSVKVSGNYAYISAHDKVRIIDITTKASPVAKGYVSFAYSWGLIDVYGDYLYVGDRSGTIGLRIIDISDKDNPAEVGFLATTSAAYDVTYKDDVVYVSASGKLHIIDVSTKTAPSELTSFAVDTDTRSNGIVGDLLYVAQSGGFTVYDIRNPSVPILLETYTGASGLNPKIYTVETYIYLLLASGTWQIVESVENVDTPTTSDGSTDEGGISSLSAFTSSVTGLVTATYYKVRAYATNTYNTVYGEVVTFETL